MHYIWLALIGLVIGAVAKFLTPGRDPGGCIVTMLVGLVGSALGAAIAGALNINASSGIAWFIMSVIGAIILLIIYHLVIGRRNAP
ncbi:MAG TPA: GlsB/YeaQ/YmgE family stress response membrane protein [Candidatus Kapabacteria bacterium]|jgi:uncharacterized membrane protein YeaQ/YmgE (transglycosylase-associated protein family)|nr:GlsB/YeaQ/YmgE family stress response membrane protein [Candidatus Kapabacteria bacterium]